ncbi:hypothetical protein R078138_01570 [Convivina praedatoris]|uniref:Uncharacterized protein n=1 Tax=Convivina praedatoris TaxID=2880963 RepID=A0ABM9D410_9LACO|nr:hypothetical protein R077815_01342 [Convivina sp. LMG 32447]CAH1856450.1 hypothetical protein LMG032447_01288 [Convivina sp. LMG 32447]CAH1857347.1 hypothetical protein R078138_01570 [Convivina sp. LMG 32447]
MSITILSLLSLLDATASTNTEQVDNQPTNDQMETQADTPRSVVNVLAVNLQTTFPRVVPLIKPVTFLFRRLVMAMIGYVSDYLTDGY